MRSRFGRNETRWFLFMFSNSILQPLNRNQSNTLWDGDNPMSNSKDESTTRFLKMNTIEFTVENTPSVCVRTFGKNERKISKEKIPLYWGITLVFSKTLTKNLFKCIFNRRKRCTRIYLKIRRSYWNTGNFIVNKSYNIIYLLYMNKYVGFIHLEKAYGRGPKGSVVRGFKEKWYSNNLCRNNIEYIYDEVRTSVKYVYWKTEDFTVKVFTRSPYWTRISFHW